MEIPRHISSLLYEHDCVVVPGFGGFVCNVSPARVHEGKNLFSPPFKKISFNRNLKSNDGLLAHFISQQENISYSKANECIAEYIEQLTRHLHDEKRFEIKKIGTFFLGEENTIGFEQDETVNYLPEAFGLAAFYSPAIKRETLERKIEKKLEDRKIIPSRQEKQTAVPKRRTPVRRYIALAASFLFIAGLTFISLKSNLLQKINIAGMNPFGPNEKALYGPEGEAFHDPDATKDNVRDLLASNRNDTTHYLNIYLNGNIPIVVSLEDETAVVKETKVKSHKTGKYHIIGGAFSVPENALKFKKKLEKLGYDAFIIEKKLQFVSYGSYATREEAMQALEKIKAAQGDAWIMAN